MRPEGDIVAQCQNHLEDLPGVRKATIRTPVRSLVLSNEDLGLVLDTDVGQFRYFGSVKRRLTLSTLDHWLLLAFPKQRRRDAGKLILFADHVSPSSAQRLREAGVDYVDAAGNLVLLGMFGTEIR